MAEDKKADTFEQKLVKAHPKFLEYIKEVYPLAVLGSLCMAISAFTKDTYPQAQAYAITAATLFLIAFASSFLQKVSSGEGPAFTSFASTALAIIFLLLVVVEFAKAILLVNRAILGIPLLLMLVGINYALFGVLRLVSKARSMLTIVCGTASAGLVLLCSVFLILSYVIGMMETSTLPEPNGMYVFTGLAVGLGLSVVTKSLVDKEAKKEKAKTLAISGSP